MNEGTTTGYKEIHIKPYIPDEMDWTEASLETVRGTVSSRWEKTDNGLSLNVTIPANTSGKISIPKLDWGDVQISENGEVIWDNGKVVENNSGIIDGMDVDGFVVLGLESGSYEFEVTGN